VEKRVVSVIEGTVFNEVEGDEAFIYLLLQRITQKL
jgi:hypothetical protein